MLAINDFRDSSEDNASFRIFGILVIPQRQNSLLRVILCAVGIHRKYYSRRKTCVERLHVLLNLFDPFFIERALDSEVALKFPFPEYSSDVEIRDFA